MKKVDKLITKLRQSSKKVKIGIILGLSMFILIGGTGVYALTSNNGSDKPATTTKTKNDTKKSSNPSETEKKKDKDVSKDKEEKKDAGKQTSSNDDTTDTTGNDENMSNDGGASPIDTGTTNTQTNSTNSNNNTQSNGTTGTGSSTNTGGSTPTPTPQPEPPVCSDTLGNSGMRFNSQSEAVNYAETIRIEEGKKEDNDWDYISWYAGYEASTLKCGGWTVTFY